MRNRANVARARTLLQNCKSNCNIRQESQIHLGCKMESLGTPESSPSSFFGSPSEPIYADSKHVLSADLLQDSLMLLASKNDSALLNIQKSSVERSRDDCMEFKSGYPILFLFELCKHFKLVPEVQYRAAELFHRFMISHIAELYQVSM